MDIKGIRILTLAACICFGVFGVLNSLGQLAYAGINGFFFYRSLLPFCLSICLIYIVFIIGMSFVFYNKTVVGIDEGDYDKVKRWMIVGMVMGFIFGGGVIVLGLFLIAYIFLNEEIKKGTV